MSPGSVRRPGKADGKKRLVRYYVSQKAIKHGYRNCTVKTVNARHMDDLVRALVVDYLASISLDRLAKEPPEVRDHWIREILDVVVLTTERLVIQLDTIKIAECREAERDGTPTPELTPVPTCPFKPEIESRGRYVVIVLPIRIKRLDGRKAHPRLPRGARPHPAGRARAEGPYRERDRARLPLARRAPRFALHDREPRKAPGLSESRIRKLLPLTLLGPEILKAALKGLLPPSVTLDDLLAAAESLGWPEQSAALGLPPPPPPGPRPESARMHAPSG